MKTSGRGHLERLEERLLESGAARSNDEKLTVREHSEARGSCPYRLAYHRDYTRVLHSRAFRRLHHKTQVFISPENDHLCTRLEHSLYVASIAKTIARTLRLNEDLVQAIAIGHDLGHAPFGHEGEKVLDKLARKHGLEGFEHELHGLRVVDKLDSPYLAKAGFPGLNLTFAVRDGIACHCGENFEATLRPEFCKRPEDLRRMERGAVAPCSLEGCVVRYADKISYLGRDLEDAYTLRLTAADQVPRYVREHLGASNSEMVNRLVGDLVANSVCTGENAHLAIGAEMTKAVNELYAWSKETIYQSAPATASFRPIERIMEPLFSFLLEEIEGCQKRGDVSGLRKPKGQEVWALRVLADFLKQDVANWHTEPPAQLTVDFIAGMTDAFFKQAVTDIFFPRGVR